MKGFFSASGSSIPGGFDPCGRECIIVFVPFVSRVSRATTTTRFMRRPFKITDIRSFIKGLKFYGCFRCVNVCPSVKSPGETAGPLAGRVS